MPEEIFAIDVGNTRLKAGRFAAPNECVQSAQAGVLPIAGPAIPEPIESLSGTIDDFESGALAELLSHSLTEKTRLAIASVSKPITDRLVQLTDSLNQSIETLVIPTESFPVKLLVDYPERLGADRAAAAVAAVALRKSNTPVVVIDVGTAITIDLVNAAGEFEGGAILPGPRLAATALAERTDALPCAEIHELDIAPDAVGQSTEPAILAGIFWGAVGSIREIIDRQRDRLTVAPQVFLTGGAAPSIAKLIGGPDYSVRHVEHLTLSGIVLAAKHLGGK